jgi:hypothetical protein
MLQLLSVVAINSNEIIMQVNTTSIEDSSRNDFDDDSSIRNSTAADLGK